MLDVQKNREVFRADTATGGQRAFLTKLSNSELASEFASTIWQPESADSLIEYLNPQTKAYPAAQILDQLFSYAGGNITARQILDFAREKRLRNIYQTPNLPSIQQLAEQD